MVLNIIYFGYKFDLKFRVLNWFWTWTEPTEPVLLGSVQVWVQVWAEGALNWTELNFNNPTSYHCHGHVLGAARLGCVWDTLPQWVLLVRTVLVCWLGWAPGFDNISHHVMNTCFVVFEILLMHMGPIPWMHLLLLVIMLGLYPGVAYITCYVWPR